jgi:ferredoxin
VVCAGDQNYSKSSYLCGPDDDQVRKSSTKKEVMAIMITDECINCGACEPECPNNAIYEGGVEWAISDGTSLTGEYALEDGSVVGADKKNNPVSNEYYYIVPDKCTECVGFHEEPQCAAVCPVDCCVPDPERVESKELLLDRKARLHL